MEIHHWRVRWWCWSSLHQCTCWWVASIREHVKVFSLIAGNMSKHKGLRLCYCISKASAPMGCSQSALVSIKSDLMKVGVNQQGAKTDLFVPVQQVTDWSSHWFMLMLVLIETCQNTQRVAVCCTWGCTAVRMSTLTPVYCQKGHQCTPEHQNRMMEKWEKVPSLSSTNWDNWDKSKVLSWASDSTDISSVEHLWGVLDKQVQSKEALPHSLHDFQDLLQTLMPNPTLPPSGVESMAEFNLPPDGSLTGL